MNRITVELAAGNLDYLAKHGVVHVHAHDAAGGTWAVRLRRAKDGGVAIVLAPIRQRAPRTKPAARSNGRRAGRGRA